ncbi:MAG: protoporphyrinogen oxidase [Gallionellales bacterium RIFCSPLOWO2_12_FULL_59_22]|nr:MAG: protoporphyrinogen oxidase [Gallionellales bacterium RIFCSPLOWO2_02_FULL_59_110]OGT04288.1 MAG: protoporphyrinogen oxidase [Gallionellales bacterium RIFCSPLOWO2_02_58_13]OGT13268.1 MAG: protoporphyrinogen oxidase [Gallionellales bacterium RIFCSPLOWO2_12_FULL_59_22]
MHKVDVLIIGGGISGLASAWWLARSGLSVEVWEAGERPGGKIMSTRQDGYLTERAAAMVLNFRPEVAELVREAGLEPAKTARQPAAEVRRYLLHRGCLKALPMRLSPMVASPLWSLRGKLRLLAEPFIFSSGRTDETVSEFITRRLGREVLEKAMEPFVAGTLAADADQASAAAVLPRLMALEQRYGSIGAGVLVNRILRRRTASVTETFSFRDGMGSLVEALAKTPGINMRTGHVAQELARERDGWQATAATPHGQRSVSAAHVIVATPAPAAVALVDPLDNELAELLRGIGYAPVSIVHTGVARDAVQHPLDGAGFLAPKGESATLTGNLWMSTLFPDRAPPGKALLTSYLGGARAPHVADWDDARLLDEALGTLRSLIGLKADPEMVRIDRHGEALPMYHGAYQARMQAISARLQHIPGLHLEANYRGGVSVRDRLVCSHAVADRILGARHWPSVERKRREEAECRAKTVCGLGAMGVAAE